MNRPVLYVDVPCPLCGGTGGPIVLVGHDALAGRDVQVRRCDGCGLCRTDPRPADDRLGDYYARGYHAHKPRRDKLAGRRGGRLITRLRAAFGPGGTGDDTLCDGLPLPASGTGRLLDLGCGDGTLLRMMRVVGWDVLGVDFSPASVGLVRNLGIEAHLGTLPHPAVPPQSVDAVILQHALEHVPDPLATLNAVRDVLRPGGRIKIVVPNFGAWEVARFGRSALGIDLPRHLTHFVPQTLADTLRTAGFADVATHDRRCSGFVRKSARTARAEGNKSLRTWWLTTGCGSRLFRPPPGGGSEVVGTATARPA